MPKPYHVQKAIDSGDFGLLSRMGKKGGKKKLTLPPKQKPPPEFSREDLAHFNSPDYKHIMSWVTEEAEKRAEVEALNYLEQLPNPSRAKFIFAKQLLLQIPELQDDSTFYKNLKKLELKIKKRAQ